MNEVKKVILINYKKVKGERIIKQLKNYNIPYSIEGKIDNDDLGSIVILDCNYIYENDLIKYILGSDFDKKNVIFYQNIKRIYDIDKYLNNEIKYEKANINYFYLTNKINLNHLAIIDKKIPNTDIKLIDINKLKPIESHNKKRVKELSKIITKEELWTVPLIVDKNNYLILDGHHRFEVAKMLNFKRIPAILVDYKNIDVWSLRKKYVLNYDIVTKHAMNNKIYPYKTVKHKYPFSIPRIEYKLGELK